jgi:hypothetical protein
MTDLRIGAAILHEAIQTAEKEDDEGLRLKMAKAEEEMRIKRVCSLPHDKPLWNSIMFVPGKGCLPR